ncbi:MAG: helix-turn-helix transcriptional regulator [Thermodesulfobacteriota bacterium]|nr:helix-turn-helix transcriptional regulator [Thermodesulfobacteriota bacterium]
MNFKSAQGYALLGILMTGLKHGYDIHNYFCTHLNQFWYLGMSQIYALLKRMEKDGMVASTQKLQETRPPKRIFSITKKGKDSFVSWVQSPVEHIRDIRIEFMAKLFFIKRLKLDNGGDLISKQIDVCQKKIGLIEKRGDLDKDGFQIILLNFKIARIKATIEWLNQCKTFYI